ncbi:MAG: type II toxin-antitoxin system VapC family toxin [Candidatus Omnitrophica bacterium]|nr:type II toxin-antitoxin system VapC family toxin [Candidatus Omnitrophota bacterium]
MRLVLDTNVFIFAFGEAENVSCVRLIETLTVLKASIHIPRTIIREVQNSLRPILFKEFILFLNKAAHIEEDHVVSFELGMKYEAMGLKPADAFIGSFTEWVGAEILVSENRHFLSRQSNLPFKVLTAEKCLKFFK